MAIETKNAVSTPAKFEAGKRYRVSPNDGRTITVLKRNPTTIDFCLDGDESKTIRRKFFDNTAYAHDSEIVVYGNEKHPDYFRVVAKDVIDDAEIENADTGKMVAEPAVNTVNAERIQRSYEEISGYVDEYVAEGMTPEEAEQAVTQELLDGMIQANARGCCVDKISRWYANTFGDKADAVAEDAIEDYYAVSQAAFDVAVDAERDNAFFAKPALERYKICRGVLGHTIDSRGRYMWHDISGRIIDKQRVAELLSEYGLTVDEYLACEKIADAEYLAKLDAALEAYDAKKLIAEYAVTVEAQDIATNAEIEQAPKSESTITKFERPALPVLQKHLSEAKAELASLKRARDTIKKSYSENFSRENYNIAESRAFADELDERNAEINRQEEFVDWLEDQVAKSATELAEEYAVTVEAQDAAIDAEIEQANDDDEPPVTAEDREEMNAAVRKFAHAIKDNYEQCRRAEQFKAQAPVIPLTGNITVDSGAKAFALVGEYFPNGLTFQSRTEDTNGADEFTFTDGGEMFLNATCTPDNRRIEYLEVINTDYSAAKRKPLSVLIKPPAHVDEEFFFGQGTVTVTAAEAMALIEYVARDEFEFRRESREVDYDENDNPVNVTRREFINVHDMTPGYSAFTFAEIFRNGELHRVEFQKGFNLGAKTVKIFVKADKPIVPPDMAEEFYKRFDDTSNAMNERQHAILNLHHAQRRAADAEKHAIEARRNLLLMGNAIAKKVDAVIVKEFVPLKRKMTLVTQNGETFAIDFTQFTVTYCDHKFHFENGFTTLAGYNYPEEVTDVFNKLKAAIERGDTGFKFPTVDELSGTENSKMTA